MKNKNLPLIIGIAIPFIFILIFIAFAYIPKMSIDPQYDFLYTTNDGYYYRDEVYSKEYKVVDGTIETTSVMINSNLNNRIIQDVPQLYRYDVSEDTANVISFEEAQKLHLDSSPSSPDGYTVDYEYSNSGIFELFGNSSRESGYYISDGKGAKRLTGLGNSNYRYNFTFIGWIK